MVPEWLDKEKFFIHPFSRGPECPLLPKGEYVIYKLIWPDCRTTQITACNIMEVSQSRAPQDIWNRASYNWRDSLV